jgi:hypothetical protein
MKVISSALKTQQETATPDPDVSKRLAADYLKKEKENTENQQNILDSKEL